MKLEDDHSHDCDQDHDPEDDDTSSADEDEESMKYINASNIDVWKYAHVELYSRNIT